MQALLAPFDLGLGRGGTSSNSQDGGMSKIRFIPVLKCRADPLSGPVVIALVLPEISPASVFGPVDSAKMMIR